MCVYVYYHSKSAFSLIIDLKAYQLGGGHTEEVILKERSGY